MGRWVRNATKSQFWKELIATSREIQDLPRKVMDEVEIQKVLDDLDRSTREVNALSDDFDSMDNAEIEAEARQDDQSHQISPFSDESEKI